MLSDDFEERRCYTLKTDIDASLKHLGFGGRRKSDMPNTYVDHYEGSLLLSTIIIVMSSAVDALLTQKILDTGGMELNFFMLSWVEQELQNFLYLKLLLTALAITLLVVHKNFNVLLRFRVKSLIHLIASGYLVLIVYELVILNTI